MQVKRTLPVVENSQSESSLPDLTWIYAHGQLEDRMGFDCLCGSLVKTAGIHPCVFKDDEGEASALAFMWADTRLHRQTSGPARVCGLVVLKGDLSAIKHAASRMLEAKGV
jgi:hypothetical protein